MRALDTNVLVRYLVEDDPEQGARAAACIESAVEEDEPLFISDIVVCETVWVLSSAYGLSRGEIADVLGRLLRAQGLRFGSHDRLHRALRAYRKGAADFADYLLAEEARDAGCAELVSFDSALVREGRARRP